MGDTSGDEIERLLADLEQQAHGLHLRERDDEVALLLPAEYARVHLEARLHGSVGLVVTVRSRAGIRIGGTLTEAGHGWFALTAGSREWLLLTASVLSVAGLGERSLVEDARPVSARLGPAAPLRELAEGRASCLLVLGEEVRLEGRLRRVGADFVEIEAGGTVEAVPFAALCAVVADARGA